MNEKEIVEILERVLLARRFDGLYTSIEIILEAIQDLLDLYNKAKKEIEHQKEKRENQKKELAILNAKQIEFNKLVNTVNSYKGQLKKQQKKIKELKQENLIQRSQLNSVWDRGFIHKDKIKAKIEELEKLDFGTDLVSQFTANLTTITILQSLLEKE